MTWRAFYGQWGQWAHTDQEATSWAEARELLAGELRELLSARCPDCRAQAQAALADLGALPEGSEFEAEIDGEDYRLYFGGPPGQRPAGGDCLFVVTVDG
jgi:hypothetical protein